jgi:Mg2+ and Co2+ transporter CorA
MAFEAGQLVVKVKLKADTSEIDKRMQLSAVNTGKTMAKEFETAVKKLEVGFNKLEKNKLFKTIRAFSAKLGGSLAKDIKNGVHSGISAGMEMAKSGNVFKALKGMAQGLGSMLFGGTGEVSRLFGVLKKAIQGGTGSMITSMGTFAIALGIAFKGVQMLVQAIIAFGQKAYEFVRTAGKAEQAVRAFGNVMYSFGRDGQQVLEALREATDNTISDEVLRKMANTGAIMGVSVENMIQYAKGAVAASAVFGTSIEQNFEDVVRGAARGSVQILDNLGIIINADEVYKKYAQTIGVTTDKLTDMQKKTAMQNEVASKMATLISRAGDATKGAGTNMDKLSTIFSNFATQLKEEVGKELIPFTKQLLLLAPNVVDLTQTLLKLTPALKAISPAITTATAAVSHAFAILNIQLQILTFQWDSATKSIKRYIGYLREFFNLQEKGGRILFPWSQSNKLGTSATPNVIKTGTEEAPTIPGPSKETLEERKRLRRELMTEKQKIEDDYMESIKISGGDVEAQTLALQLKNKRLLELNKEFAEKRAEEIKREVEAEAQSVEQTLQVIEEIEDLKVEALGKGFANQLAEIDRWRDKQLDKYRDWKEAEVLIELIAQQRKKEILDAFNEQVAKDEKVKQEEIEDLKIEALGKGLANQLAKVDQWKRRSLEKYQGLKEAEILIELIAQQRRKEILDAFNEQVAKDEEERYQKIVEGVDAAIEEVNRIYEEEADRLKGITDSIKTSFEQLLNIFSNTQNRMTGFVAFLGSTFGEVLSEAAGIFGKFAKAEKGASKDGVKGNDSLGESFKKLGANVIESLKQQAVVQAVMEFAAGLQALARLDFRAAGLHFASSALYGTIAAMQIATALGAGGGGGGNYYNNSANEPGGGSYTYSLDNVNPNTGTNVTIYAMDSQSFSDFANRNKGAFAVAVEGALRNNISRRKIGNNL